MNLINYGHIIGRENNVVRVDFGREADPPAPKFPGASLDRVGNHGFAALAFITG
jgi:hypothetical protein